MVTTEAIPATGRGRFTRGTLTAVYLALIATGVVLALRDEAFAQLPRLLTADLLGYLVVACLCNIASLLVSMAPWWVLLSGFGHRITAVPAAHIYFTGYLGRYIPGRVWTVLAYIRLGGASGVSGGVMVAVFGLHIAIATITGASLGLVIAPSVGLSAGWLVVPLVVLVLGLIRPGYVTAAVAALSRLLRRPLTVPSAADSGLRIAITAQIASWCAAGTHLWVLAIALGADPLHALPAAVGGFALGSIAGSYAIIAPDGVGVRDAILVLVLSTVLPLPAAILSCIASRVVTLVTEVGASGAIVLIAGVARHRRLPRPPETERSHACRS